MIKTNIKMRVTPEQSRRVQEICFENGINWEYLSNDIQDSLEEKYLYIRDFIKFGREESNFINSNLEEIDTDLFIKTNGTCEEDLIDKISNELEEETDEYYDLREALAKGKIIQLNGTAVNGGYGETWNDYKQEDLFIFGRNAYRIKNELEKESIYNFDNPKSANMTKDDYIASLENRLEFLEGCKKETVEPLLKKIENLHIALNKKVEKNSHQALEINRLLVQNRDLQEINDAQNNNIRELENRLNQLNSSGTTANDTMSNYVDDLHTKLKEKDTIISYLESKLK